jgi:hypothetical protein
MCFEENFITFGKLKKKNLRKKKHWLLPFMLKKKYKCAMVACHLNFQFQILALLERTKELGLAHFIWTYLVMAM